jgi:hypothetical protein
VCRGPDWFATLTGKGGKALAPATKRRALVTLQSVMTHCRKMKWLRHLTSAPEWRTEVTDRFAVWDEITA